jgi:hypothetical protein
MNTIDAPSTISPWVAGLRENVTFAIELGTTATPVNDRLRAVVTSGQLAEQLGFEAVLRPIDETNDKTTFQSNCRCGRQCSVFRAPPFGFL